MIVVIAVIAALLLFLALPLIYVKNYIKVPPNEVAVFTGRGTPIVVHAIQAGATRINPNSGPDGVGVQEGIAYTLEARAEVQAVSVVSVPAVSVALRGRDGGATAEMGDDLAGCLRASSGGGDKPHVLALSVYENQQAVVRLSEYTPALSTGGGKPGQGYPAALHAGLVRFAVRRLTPSEVERLMGFPEGYTDVPRGNRAAADGTRYKELGNSKAVPVVRWIGERIQKCLT